jgi:hypothetical protein
MAMAGGHVAVAHGTLRTIADLLGLFDASGEAPQQDRELTDRDLLGAFYLGWRRRRRSRTNVKGPTEAGMKRPPVFIFHVLLECSAMHLPQEHIVYQG